MSDVIKASWEYALKLFESAAEISSVSASEREAFLAGAAWQREQDLSILRSTKADQFLSTYSMGIAADYLEAATKQDNDANS